MFQLGLTNICIQANAIPVIRNHGNSIFCYSILEANMVFAPQQLKTLVKSFQIENIDSKSKSVNEPQFFKITLFYQ